MYFWDATLEESPLLLSASLRTQAAPVGIEPEATHRGTGAGNPARRSSDDAARVSSAATRGSWKACSATCYLH